jgi:transposase InsO family protein
LTGKQVAQAQRDEVVAFVDKWAVKVEWTVSKMLNRIGVRRGKYYDWCRRQGEANQHNGKVPCHNWLTPSEKAVVVDYYTTHPEVGYRQMTYLMLDEGVVAVSASSVYRVLKANGCLRERTHKPSKKGTGFDQPTRPHQHWHIDITYLRIGGVFYYMCSILDGYSRFIVHWEIRESMREPDIELIIQRAKERSAATRTRIISDNGPQFVARDFKQFIRLINFMHVRTSPYYPQSNGKLERWHQTLKQNAIRPKTPLTLADARACVTDFVDHYNNTRLHSAIGYVTPAQMLHGCAPAIFAVRKKKLHAARDARQLFWLNHSHIQSNVKDYE